MAWSGRKSDERDARAQAAPVALVSAAGLVLLAFLSKNRWQLLGTSEDWWIWLIVAAPVALVGIELTGGLGVGKDAVARRRAASVLIGLTLAGSLTGLGLLVTTLLRRGSELGAAQLLVTGAVLLLTNVAAFGIGLWELDCGGPVARATQPTARAHPDLQFPQDENPALAAPGWSPHPVDYLYVSLTNSIAFSPTDAMPLTRHVKGLMAIQSVTSAITVLVVAARAVNIIGT